MYDKAKKKVRTGSAYSQEFEVEVHLHQGCVLSALLFAIVVDVITENPKSDKTYEVLLHADNLLRAKLRKIK